MLEKHFETLREALGAVGAKDADGHRFLAECFDILRAVESHQQEVAQWLTPQQPQNQSLPIRSSTPEVEILGVEPLEGSSGSPPPS